MLQLACVQAANQVSVVKRVYSNLTTLWKMFYYFPKKAENLKEIQVMLNMLQLKMLKPTDTRWLSHENTIRSINIALVVSLQAIHKESSDAQAHGLAVLLKNVETVAAIYMLSEVLGSIARLCKSWQTKGFEVPLAVSSTLQELYAIQVSLTDAVWYNSLKEKISELNTASIALMKLQALSIQGSLILLFRI